MAKKYIFMTGKYMPTPGATGVCIHSLAQCLASRGEDVTTICYEDNSGENKIEGVSLFRIEAPSYFFDKQYQSKFEQIKDVWNSRLMKLVHLNKYPLRSSKLLKAYKNICLELVKGIRQENVTVIASYTPLEAVASLIYLRKRLPHARLVYYSADTLSNEQGNSGVLPHRIREKMGYKWEKTIFDVCDLILIMECHKDHYFGNELVKYNNKMRVVNFPLMDEPKSISYKTKKTMVYAGTLLRKLRNPQFTCDTLLKVLLETDYKAIFMGSGDCDDIVNDAVEKSNGKMQFWGIQPYTVASDCIETAGILLSIGNAESPMAPSKIYEYMATGKPIIHFYTWDKDSCLEPLRRYGNALLIKNDDANAVDKVKEFALNVKMLTYSDVRELFLTSTPTYSIDMIK